MTDYASLYPNYTPTCSQGVPLCDQLDAGSLDVCSELNNDWMSTDSLTWATVLASILAAIMCVAIGANDAANAWATAVGSGALPIRFAVILGGFMEWAGAMALGFGVAKTVTKGTAKVVEPECFACGYCDSKMTMYATGMFAALMAASLFLALSTFSSLPVSTTHAIIGSVVGATVTTVGFDCLSWKWEGGLGGIIGSWFISPVLSGTLAVIVYFFTKYTMIYPPAFFPEALRNPRRNALVLQPIIAGLHTFIIVYMTMLKTPQTKKEAEWVQLVPAAVCALFVGVCFALFTYYRQRRSLPSVWAKENEERKARGEEAVGQLGRGEFKKPDNKILAFFWNNDPFFRIPNFLSCCKKSTETDDSDSTEMEVVATDNENNEEAGPSTSKAVAKVDESKLDKFELREKEKAEKLLTLPMDVQDAHYCFRALLIYNAIWDAFAHGANDTGNATGALAGVLNVYENGQDSCGKGDTPVYVMAAAGLFMFIGITFLGQFVIKTIGSKLAFIDYHIGFCVEMASTIAVIIATYSDLPVSTTHCQVGAIIFTGIVSDIKSVQWKWFGAVSAGWLLTVPLAALISAAFTAMLREAVIN